MTPEWASQILERNPINRTIRPYRIRLFASDMACGRWLLTPQTVSITSDGRLLDGQHRLMAVALSGQSVPMMLATDCPPECFAAIDIGLARTPGDILKIEGSSSYNITAAAIRLVYCYKTHPHLVWVGQLGATKQQILNIYREDPDTWTEVVKFAVGFKNAPCVQVSAISAFLYLYHSSTVDRVLTRDYLNLYCTGEMLSSGNPILAFRNWQAAQYKIAQVKKAQTQLACHLKAYRYWKDDAQLKIFKQPQIPPMPQL